MNKDPVILHKTEKTKVYLTFEINLELLNYLREVSKKNKVSIDYLINYFLVEHLRRSPNK